MSKESKTLQETAGTNGNFKAIGSKLLDNALYILMLIAAVYIAIKNPNFIQPGSIINIISQTAAYLPAALGVAGCIVLTGTDLSAGRIVGLTACISASLMQVVGSANKMWPNIGTLNPFVVLAMVMVVGAMVGCFNGFFVAKFKLHPFIVTLATQLILYTFLLLYVQMGNNKGMAISSLDVSYKEFITGSVFAKMTNAMGIGTATGGIQIPNYVWIAAILVG
ncbi:MAG: beta-methylgalactoside transporter, partial [Oscillospiraceae bacterium]